MTWSLIQNTLLVGVGSTVMAMLLGLIVALALCSVGRVLRNGLLALALVTLALPPFLVANTWMQYLGDTGVWHDWIPLNLFSPAGAILLLSLWLWPVTAMLVWSAWQRLEPAHLEAEPDLRGAALLRFLLLPLSRGNLAIAGLITLVLAANNLTVPALLQVNVHPAAVWLSFSSSFWVTPEGAFDWVTALSLSWPLVVLPWVVVLLLRRRAFQWPALSNGVPPASFRRGVGLATVLGAGLVSVALLVLSPGLPLWQVAGDVRTWSQLPEVFAAGRGAIFTSVAVSAAVATLCAAVALFSVLPMSRRQSMPQPGISESRSGRGDGETTGRAWNACSQICRRDVGSTLLWLPFLVPGVLIGIALIQLLNRPLTAWLYQSLGVVILALVIRYFAIGWSMARQAARSADPDLNDAALLDGASRWQLLRHVLWPQIAPRVAAAWCIMFLLCLWDVETLVLIIPPGGETLALRVFNLLHYGHTAHVNALCLMLLGLAVGPLLVVAALVRVRRRLRSGRGIHALTGVAMLVITLGVGCSPGAGPNSRPVDSRFFERVQIIATRGVGPGEVNKPRSVAVGKDDSLYVLDFTGRVQKFSPEGEFLLFWQMPETKRGNPKGLSVDNDGNILVTEPHYCRVNLFTPEGRLLAQWGERGTNAGQLSFPRAAVVNSAGDLFVCEFQLVERVQRFAVRMGADGQRVLDYVTGFGVRGDAPGEFSRAEGLCVDGEDHVVAADACNHRIQVFDSGGRFLREFGQAGNGAGELSYPYDVCVDGAGRHYVCEFGNSRVQVFDAAGLSLEILGGPGAAPGLFNNPWGVALDSRGNLYVADSQNHRVQKFLRKAEGRVQKSEGSSQASADVVGCCVAQASGLCEVCFPSAWMSHHEINPVTLRGTATGPSVAATRACGGAAGRDGPRPGKKPGLTHTGQRPVPLWASARGCVLHSAFCIPHF